MSGIIGTGNLPRLLQDGVKEVFGNEYNQFETQYDKIFDSNTSEKNFEVDVQLEGFGFASVKPEGDEIDFDSASQGFTPKYKMFTVAKGFIMTKEAMRDERYDQFNNKAASLATAMRQTKELIGANVLNNGFNAGFLMVDGDGQALFSESHPNGPSGGTYANTLPTDADLSEAALEDMLIIIGEATDPRGKRANLMVERLIVPVAGQFDAQRILGSVLQNNTANNATNAIRDLGSIGNWVVNRYLTDPTAWFLKTNVKAGMKYYTRQAVEFENDNAFTSSNIRMKADERYSFGWSDARGMYGSAGA